MHNLRFIFVLLFSATIFSQQQIPIFDGVFSPNEWKGAQQFSIDYEINPEDNSREQKYFSVNLKQNESLNQLLTTKVTLLNTLMLPIMNYRSYQ